MYIRYILYAYMTRGLHVVYSTCCIHICVDERYMDDRGLHVVYGICCIHICVDLSSMYLCCIHICVDERYIDVRSTYICMQHVLHIYVYNMYRDTGVHVSIIV